MKISVWIDEELLEELDKRAGDEERSRSWMVGKAVEVYLNPPKKGAKLVPPSDVEATQKLGQTKWDKR